MEFPKQKSETNLGFTLGLLWLLLPGFGRIQAAAETPRMLGRDTVAR